MKKLEKFEANKIENLKVIFGGGKDKDKIDKSKIKKPENNDDD